jgi:1-deoxy-D-xylulose-5-phosphate reductoisomerase
MSIFEQTAPTSDRRRPLRVAVLGCSGSVGTQTLDVCRTHRDKLDVVALSVNTSCAALVAAAREFDVAHVAVADATHATDPVLDELPKGCECDFGEDAVTRLASLPDVDCVLVAVVGAVGIWASYQALSSDKILACANKEALVVGGDLLMPMARPGRFLPVDSEHSALYQCLVGERRADIHRAWITCSGGPFFGRRRDELAGVTVDEALAHPSWSMGPKITIDSATLMNKGLEVIEAHHLLDLPIDQIEVVVHRQSKVHSMIEFSDGTVKAQIGPSDMRLPIQYALSYPERWDTPCDRVDYRSLCDLTFTSPDLETFRCLALALEAGRVGGTLPCALNAANEVANEAFRHGECSFTDIDAVVEAVMGTSDVCRVTSLEQLDDIDTRSRALAREVLGRMGR